MESLPVGAIDPRTGKVVEGYANWDDAPEQPGGGEGAGRRCREVSVVHARGEFRARKPSGFLPQWCRCAPYAKWSRCP